MNENDQIISRYTRAQAIEDGILVDVTEQAKETGLLLPTVITDRVHRVLEDIPKESLGQDYCGRLHDVLWMAYLKLRGLKSKGIKEDDFPADSRSSSIPRRIHCGLTQTVTVSPSCTQRTTDALMMRSLSAPYGATISLDFRKQFGDRVELDCFQFVVLPVEFRLVRNNRPLQEWQAANTDMYDLQHGPGVRQWARDDHWFINDLVHRHDAMRCHHAS